MVVIASYPCCTSPSYIYTPSAVNNPILTQKGDGGLSAMCCASVSEGETCSVVKFNSIRFSHVSTDFDAFVLIDLLLDKLDDNHISVIEGGYNISYVFKGFNHVLFTHQLTFAGISGYYDIRPLNFSLGVSYVLKPGKNHEKSARE